MNSIGYPRNDIDVHKVREGRNKIICLGNDLKAITGKIERGIHSLHAQSAQSIPKTLSSEVTLAEVSIIIYIYTGKNEVYKVQF